MRNLVWVPSPLSMKGRGGRGHHTGPSGAVRTRPSRAEQAGGVCGRCDVHRAEPEARGPTCRGGDSRRGAKGHARSLTTYLGHSEHFLATTMYHEKGPHITVHEGSANQNPNATFTPIRMAITNSERPGARNPPASAGRPPCPLPLAACCSLLTPCPPLREPLLVWS